jgi:hypothetical protein
MRLNLPETMPAMQVFDTCAVNTGKGMNTIEFSKSVN